MLLTFADRSIGLMVTGGIAAYKTCYLIRRICESGGSVFVTMTEAATKFITPLTFATLSGNPVNNDMFPCPEPENPIHLELADQCDILLVAPATGNFIGKLANGIADDLASSMALAFPGSILLAPAMNPRMWAHPAVQANVALLKARGCAFVGPDEGEMAGVNEIAGIGRMSEPDVIYMHLLKHLEERPLLEDYNVLITAGPTRESLDPVRFISNYSSGKMGKAIAEQSFLMGGKVTLVRGKGSSVSPPETALVLEVDTAAEMAAVVKEEFASTDLFVAAAAVADWTVETPSTSKLKKSSGSPPIDWSETEDILKWAGEHRKHQVLVGFALETADHHSGAQNKLKSKKVDLIALNDPQQNHSSFGGDSTHLTIFSNERQPEKFAVSSKDFAARKLLEIAAKYLPLKTT